MSILNRLKSLLDAVYSLPRVDDTGSVSGRLVTDGGRPTGASDEVDDTTTDSPTGDGSPDPSDGDETTNPNDTDEDLRSDEGTDDEDSTDVEASDGEDVFQFMTVRPPEAADGKIRASIDPRRSEGLVTSVWGSEETPTQQGAMQEVREHKQSDQFVREPSDLSLEYTALRDRLADASADASFDDIVVETFGSEPSELVESLAFETDEGQLLDSLASVAVLPADVSEDTRETIRNGVRLTDAIRRSADGENVSPSDALGRQVVLPEVVSPLPTLPAGGAGGGPDWTGGNSGTGGGSAGTGDDGLARLARRVRRMETARKELSALARNSGPSAGNDDAPVANGGEQFAGPTDETEPSTDVAEGEQPESTADADPPSQLHSDHDRLADAITENADDVTEQLSEISDDTDRILELLGGAESGTTMLTEARYADLSDATRAALSDVGASPGELSVSEVAERVTEESTRLNARLLDATVGNYERLVETEDGPMLVNDAVESEETGVPTFEPRSIDASASSLGGDAGTTGTSTPLFGSGGEITDRAAGVTALGFGDLRVVKQVGPRYEPGEIAHIENVMATESRERIHEESTVTEETTRREEQTTTIEKEDLQTTRRSEIKNETEKVINEQWGIETGVNVSAKYGPVSVDANFGYSRQESKEKSERTAVEVSQEITKQATRRVEKQVTTETIKRIREEITERNSHAFDNDTGDHITGIYRWLDKTYRMDVHEYDQPRLMFEFLVPDPAAGYRYAQRAKPKTNAAEKPVKPQAVRFKSEDWTTPDVEEGVEREDGEPVYLERLSYDDITPTNYQWYATHYGAEDVPEPPAEYQYKTTRLTQKEQSGSEGSGGYNDEVSDRDFTDFGNHDTKHVDIPDGYEVSRVRFVSDTMYRLNRGIAATIRVSAGTQPSERIQVIPYTDEEDKAKPPSWLTFVFKGSEIGPKYVDVDDREDNNYDRLPVSVMARNVDDYNVIALVRLERTDQRLRKWKAEVHKAIKRAYEERRREYESEVEAARIGEGVTIEGQNPKKNRQTERTELKRGAIELLEGETLDYDAVTTPSESDSVEFPEIDELDSLRRDVQFFEQAFEWTEGTYVFYPYYWADPDTWVEKMNRTNTDTQFEAFLTAGAARFVVPVRPGFEQNVLLFMQTGVPFFREGTIDDVNDRRYQDIVSELREQDGAKRGSEYTGNHWFNTVPTSLVKLQASDALPNLISPVETLYPDHSTEVTTDGGSVTDALLDGGWESPTERPEEE